MIDDHYTYLNSGGVLVNNFGINDPAKLEIVVNDIVSEEWATLSVESQGWPITYGTLARIHKRLFSDVFTWAGRLRDVDATATGTGIAYCRPEFIEANLDSLFMSLKRNDRN